MITIPLLYLYVYPMTILGFVLIGVRYLMLAYAGLLLAVVPLMIVWKVLTIIF